ncbi:hypothetical protein [Pantoea stewartii]|uniref:hypothetical protein n=1 Tax=Pantoea stewartii TaxID=66269 RepID=UPI0006D1A7E4|nr:hypothetical protein [Pantoea stewartii]
MEKPFLQQPSPESSRMAAAGGVSSASLFVRRNLFSLVVGTVSLICFVDNHASGLRQVLSSRHASARPLSAATVPNPTGQIAAVSEHLPHASAPSVVMIAEANRQALKGMQLVSDQLKLEQGSLLQDMAHTQQLALQQVSDNHFQAAMLNGQLAQLDQQIRIESAQVGMAQNLVNKWRPLLNKGYISALQFAQEQSAVWGYESQYRALLQQQYATRQQLSVLEDQERQIPLATAVKLNVLRRQLAQVNENLAQNTLTEARIAWQPSAAPVKPLLVKADKAAGTPTQQTEQDSRFLSDRPARVSHSDVHYQNINDQTGSHSVTPRHTALTHNV